LTRVQFARAEQKQSKQQKGDAKGEAQSRANIVTWSGGKTSSVLNKVLKTYLKVLNTSTRD